MKVDKIFAIQCVDNGYDVTILTSSGNFAVAHCNEDFVIQHVSRVKRNDDNTYQLVEPYSVIPQECRVAISEIKDDNQILNQLLLAGYWANSSINN